MKSEGLKYLEGLETKYAAALAHVRSLIELEGGTVNREVAPATSSFAKNWARAQAAPMAAVDLKLDEVAPPNPRASMTKGDLAELMIREYGPMTVPDLFKRMKSVGHAVTNSNALRSGLSHDKRFRSIGDGRWKLIAKDDPIVVEAVAEADEF